VKGVQGVGADVAESSKQKDHCKGSQFCETTEGVVDVLELKK